MAGWFKLLVLTLFLVSIWKWMSEPSPVSYGPGVVVKDSPIQTKLNRAPSFARDEYTVTPVAKFELTAKVLAKRNYSFGREADLSPTDLALGWGRMSDESVLEQIKITQANRYYAWRVEEFPIPRKEIETHSANMHFIPADDFVADQLKAVRMGQIVELHGHLVSVKADDGWRWKSSTSRNDTGAGACELVWLKSIEVIEPKIL